MAFFLNELFIISDRSEQFGLLLMTDICICAHIKEGSVGV